MKSGDVSVMSGDVQTQFIRSAGEEQIAHVADVSGVEM